MIKEPKPPKIRTLYEGQTTERTPINMKKFLCFIGLHNWKYITSEKTSDFGKIAFIHLSWFKVFFKCNTCNKQKKVLR